LPQPPSQTLAVGIASATSVFTVVNAVLLQPLPYQDADRSSISFHTISKLARPTRDWVMSLPYFTGLRERASPDTSKARL
jgi:hypothetical protein